MTGRIVSLMESLGSPGAGLLVVAGCTLGLRYEVVQTWLGRVQVAAIVLVVVLLVALVLRRVRGSRRTRERSPRAGSSRGAGPWSVPQGSPGADSPGGPRPGWHP